MTVATISRTHGPEVLARFHGTCKGCGDEITAGEHYIAVVDRVGVMHALCARDYCRIFDEHQEADGEEG